MLMQMKIKKGMTPANCLIMRGSSSALLKIPIVGRNEKSPTRLPFSLSISSPHRKHTINQFLRKQSGIIPTTAKQLNSILLSNKAKLNAFNELVDDIYKGELNYSRHNMFTPTKENEISRVWSSRVLSSKHSRRELVNDVKGLKMAAYSPASAKKTNQESISIAKLLQANLNTGKIDELHQIQVDKLKFFKNKSKMNCFILKVLDPDAMIEDFTEGKGKQSVHFKKFKMQLHKEKVRLTNLVNDVKQAHVMNESLLKIYTVKLKSKHSKYFNIPKYEDF